MENKQEEIDKEKQERKQEYLAMIKQWEDILKEANKEIEQDKS